MYHYIANVADRSADNSGRKIIFSESGFNRVLFVCGTIDDNITIVSMGAGEKRGIFKKIKRQISDNIQIIYLQLWDFHLLKKNTRHLFYSFFLLLYLLKNVNKNDNLILYNTSKSFFMILPILIFRIIKKVPYFLEIEELYTYKTISKKLGYSEMLSINNANAYIIVNKKIKNYVESHKPVIINVGYYPFDNFLEHKLENTKNNELRIIYSGRLDREGGILIFLESISFIEHKCKIFITGKGEYENFIQNYECKNPNVDFKYLGLIKEADYEKLLLNSQIAINPILQSDKFSEVSFPSKVTQYLTYGLYVVSSNIQSLRILNELNDYILKYDADNPKALAALINSLKIPDNSIKKPIIEKTRKYFENSKINLSNFIKLNEKK